jgi:hypothetical protein
VRNEIPPPARASGEFSTGWETRTNTVYSTVLEYLLELWSGFQLIGISIHAGKPFLVLNIIAELDGRTVEPRRIAHSKEFHRFKECSRLR